MTILDSSSPPISTKSVIESIRLGPILKSSVRITLSFSRIALGFSFGALLSNSFIDAQKNQEPFMSSYSKNFFGTVIPVTQNFLNTSRSLWLNQEHQNTLSSIESGYQTLQFYRFIEPDTPFPKIDFLRYARAQIQDYKTNLFKTFQSKSLTPFNPQSKDPIFSFIDQIMDQEPELGSQVSYIKSSILGYNDHRQSYIFLNPKQFLNPNLSFLPPNFTLYHELRHSIFHSDSKSIHHQFNRHLLIDLYCEMDADLWALMLDFMDPKTDPMHHFNLTVDLWALRLQHLQNYVSESKTHYDEHITYRAIEQWIQWLDFIQKNPEAMPSSSEEWKTLHRTLLSIAMKNMLEDFNTFMQDVPKDWHTDYKAIIAHLQQEDQSSHYRNQWIASFSSHPNLLGDYSLLIQLGLKTRDISYPFLALEASHLFNGEIFSHILRTVIPTHHYAPQFTSLKWAMRQDLIYKQSVNLPSHSFDGHPMTSLQTIMTIKSDQQKLLNLNIKQQLPNYIFGGAILPYLWSSVSPLEQDATECAYQAIYHISPSPSTLKGSDSKCQKIFNQSPK